MKFTPETLLQIYLDGSFTEEAQAEFDRLMKKDPAFAERVTHAVAERLGPAPEALVNQVASRLDGKISAVWEKHKPFLMRPLLENTVKAILVLILACGLYFGYKRFLSPGVPGNLQVQNQGIQSTAASSALPIGNHTEISKKILQAAGAKNEKTSGISPLPEANLSSNPVSSPSLQVAGSWVSSAGQTQTKEGDILRVSVETQKAQNVVVTVLNSNGSLIRGLYKGIWSAGVHLVDWDGKDEAGNPVPPGNYTVAVNADGKIMTDVVTVRHAK